MCKPLISFRAKVNGEPRWFSIDAINPEEDLVLYSVQFLDGRWRHHLATSLERFCDRTQMEVVLA